MGDLCHGAALDLEDHLGHSSQIERRLFRVQSRRQFQLALPLMRTIHAVVIGNVQGVGFRFTTRRQALHLGLAGWVRNQPDGSVALCAQGSDGAVDRLVTFLEEGPPGATVTSITIEDVTPDPALHGFDIRF